MAEAAGLVEDSGEEGEVSELVFCSILRSDYSEPISHDLLHTLVLFARNCAHVADGVPGMDDKSRLLQQTLIANKRFEMLLPIIRIIHDADQLA